MKTTSTLTRSFSLLALALAPALTGCVTAEEDEPTVDGDASTEPDQGGTDGVNQDGSGNGSGTEEPGGNGNPGGSGANGQKRVIGYFTAWGAYARNFQVSDIAADRLTHINYAFANLSNGECVLGDSWIDVEKPMGDDTWDTPLPRGNIRRLNVLKEEHPGLKTMISVGGWTWSSGFSAAAATEESRARLASSCVKFMKDYGFDGIDIDWEYPVGGGLYAGVPEDKQNYTLLLAELRRQLDEQGAADGGVHYELSIAAPAGPSIIANLELDRIHGHLDFINVMAYDFHGTWDSATNFNAPLYASASDPSANRETFNVDAAMKAYLSGGVPAEKLVMGMAFYGHGWAGVPATNDGLFQPATGAAAGKWAPGIFDYKELAELSGFTSHWSEEAKVPWMYNPTTGVMISYDDAESLGIKADYVNQNGLGGAMIWELSGEGPGNPLLGVIAGKMGR